MFFNGWCIATRETVIVNVDLDNAADGDRCSVEVLTLRRGITITVI